MSASVTNTHNPDSSSQKRTHVNLACDEIKGRWRCSPQPHHGFPTLEAEAGLNAVAASLTARGGVVVQNPTGEPLQGQITCRSIQRQLEAEICHTSRRKKSEEEDEHEGLGLRL